ncbi:NAD(P)H-hydrate epimerase [Dirofilaria immitis]
MNQYLEGCYGMRFDYAFYSALFNVISRRGLFAHLNKVLIRFRSAEVMTNANDISFLSQYDANALDYELFNTYAFSLDQLIELAGLSCAHAIARSYDRGKILVISGPGNNGGDGFVCARHLKLLGFEPFIFYPKQSKLELMERLVMQTKKMNISHLDDSVFKNPSDMKNKFTLVVDALFGFNFKPPLRQPFDRIIEAVNKSALPVAAIDIPSGWDVEKGPLEGQLAFNPDILISLTAPKLCAKHFHGRAHYVGGRFVPDALAVKYHLKLPEYPGTDCVVKLS